MEHLICERERASAITLVVPVNLNTYVKTGSTKYNRTTSCLVYPFAIYRIFVATCRTARYLLQHAPLLDIRCSKPYSFLFVAACLAVHYSLPYAKQFVVACRAVCHMSDSFLFVATLCAIHYLLQHAIPFAACFIACYLLQHAAHAAIRHCVLYNLLCLPHSLERNWVQ